MIEGFSPSGSLEDILFGIDLRGLGWAFSFAGFLDMCLHDRLCSAHKSIGQSLDLNERQLLNVNTRSISSKDYAVSDFEHAEGVPRIVFDDEEHGIGVFLKPPGWEVDDEDKAAQGKCLSEYLQLKYPWSAVVRDGGHAFGIIHRLDVPSSGLILIGTTYEGYYLLKWQLDTGQIAREYVVLCHGWIAPALEKIDAPVHHISSKSPAKKIYAPEISIGRSMVTEMGKPATTFVRVLAHAARGEWRFSLIVCRIRTGRRHQIRTHLLHMGHPTVTDGKYTRAQVFMADREWCPRNFLHRQRLVFSDSNGLEQEVTEPLPEDLRNALRQISPHPCGGQSEQAIRGCIQGSAPRSWKSYAVLADRETASVSGMPPHWAGAGRPRDEKNRLSPARDARIAACNDHREFPW